MTHFSDPTAACVVDYTDYTTRGPRKPPLCEMDGCVKHKQSGCQGFCIAHFKDPTSARSAPAKKRKYNVSDLPPPPTLATAPIIANNQREPKKHERTKKVAKKKQNPRPRQQQPQPPFVAKNRPCESINPDGATTRIKVCRLNEDEEDEEKEEVTQTKEKFEQYRDDLLSRIPENVKSLFREGGFAKWSMGEWLPVLELGPFDVEPGPLRDKWLFLFEKVS